VTNPIAQGADYLRRSLMPNLLVNTAMNLRFHDNFNIFEIGRVFIKELKGEAVSDKEKRYLPRQDYWLAGAIVEKDSQEIFYVVKNYLEQVLKQLRFTYELIKGEDLPAWFSAERSLAIKINNKIVGYVGELASAAQQSLSLKSRVGLFEINIDLLAANYNDAMSYQPIPKFPAIDLDLSVILDKSVLWQEIYNAVAKVDKELIKEIKLVDVYEGEGIPVEKKSLTFRTIYRSDDRTLELKEAENIQQQIISILEKKFEAKVRA